MRMTERLYLTADKKKLANENQRLGRFLFCRPGDEIPNREAIKYGLMKSPEEVAAESEKKDAEEKKRIVAENRKATKEKKAAPNKKLTISRLSGQKKE